MPPELYSAESNHVSIHQQRWPEQLVKELGATEDYFSWMPVLGTVSWYLKCPGRHEVQDEPGQTLTRVQFQGLGGPQCNNAVLPTTSEDDEESF